MIGLPDIVGSFGFASVKKIIRSPVGFTAIVGQGDQGGGKVLNDPIHPMIIGNRPSVAERHVTHLSVDKGHSRRRFAEREPFDYLCEVGGQSVRLSAITTLATGQSGKAIAPVLGESPLHGAQRNAAMAGDMGQRYVVFNAGLEHAISCQCSRSLFGRSLRQWHSVLGLLVHRALLYDRLPPKKLCREYNCLGKDGQERSRCFKEFAHAAAARSTFIFGKVVRRASPGTAQEAETEPLRA